MTLPLPALANAFFYAAAALGLPSATGILLYTGYLLHRQLAPADGSFGAVKNPDAILIMLKGMASVIEGIAKLLSFLGKYVMTGIAVLSVVGLVLAVGFWLTGRGLHAHQPWARWLAGVITGVVLVPSVCGLLAVRGLPFLFAAACTIACIFALVTLVRDFPV